MGIELKLCTGCYNRVSRVYLVDVAFPYDPIEEELCQGCVKGINKRIKEFLKIRKRIK